MPLIFNGVTIETLYFNGVELTTAEFNGVEVFTATSYPYDAMYAALELTQVDGWTYTVNIGTEAAANVIAAYNDASCGLYIALNDTDDATWFTSYQNTAWVEFVEEYSDSTGFKGHDVDDVYGAVEVLATGVVTVSGTSADDMRYWYEQHSINFDAGHIINIELEVAT